MNNRTFYVDVTGNGFQFTREIDDFIGAGHTAKAYAEQWPKVMVLVYIVIDAEPVYLWEHDTLTNGG